MIVYHLPSYLLTHFCEPLTPPPKGVSGLSELRIANTLRKLAFGGCAVNTNPSYSVVGHDHKDHIVRDLNITVVGPVRPHVRSRNVLRVSPGDFVKLHVSSSEILVWVLSTWHLRQLGIPRRLHTFPVVLKVEDEFAVYIDDIDIEDVEHVKTLLSNLKKSYGDLLKVALLPVYGRSKQHGSQTSTELHEKSIELLKFANELGLTVIALAHPIIPPDLPEFAIPFFKIIKTLE